MVNDSQDCVRKVGGVFFLFSLNCQDEDGIVFAKVLEEASLESHFNYFAQYLIFFDNQTNDFIKNDLVAVSIVNNVFAI